MALAEFLADKEITDPKDLEENDPYLYVLVLVIARIHVILNGMFSLSVRLLDCLSLNANEYSTYLNPLYFIRNKITILCIFTSINM